MLTLFDLSCADGERSICLFDKDIGIRIETLKLMFFFSKKKVDLIWPFLLPYKVRSIHVAQSKAAANKVNPLSYLRLLSVKGITRQVAFYASES